MLLLRDLMKFISKPENILGDGEEGRGGREGGRGVREVSSLPVGVQNDTQSASPHHTPISDPRLLGALGGRQTCAS